MKVDIPDSIIISRDDDGVIHHSYWTTDQELIPFEDTKFIRKDALLEWAKEQLDILNKQTLLHHDDEVFWGQRNAFKQLIDKLNSM